MKKRTKRWKATVWRCLHLLALTGCLITAVIGVVDEILGSPAWEGVLAKIGISNGWRFFLDRLRLWNFSVFPDRSVEAVGSLQAAEKP